MKIISTLLLALFSLSSAKLRHQKKAQISQVSDTPLNITTNETLQVLNSTVIENFNYSDPEYGIYLDYIIPDIIGFDMTTSSEERDDIYHFFIYADKTKIYAWDPIRRS